MDEFNHFFNENRLYGDDFSLEEIRQWYDVEAEAYANLYGLNSDDESYGYANLNQLYGFRYIKDIDSFHHVLGFGSSWGYEFLPIIDKIKKLTIIESSIQTRSLKINELVPEYKSPNVEGTIDFPDNSFDLITCFSTLHHIPNVSFVLKELFRVLKNGGFMLLREPVNSMGDWRDKRIGLTANERGIPKDYLSNIIHQHGMVVVKKHYYYCMTAFFMRAFKKLNPDAWQYLYLDKFLSSLFIFNMHYHPTNILQRISPTSVFYVLKKPLISDVF